MGLPEERYCAMLEVGHCARRHKIPGPSVASALAARWEDRSAFRRGDAGQPDQPPGDNWTASWACGVRMLDAGRAAGIP